jgi:cysteine-rich repeat protein
VDQHHALDVTRRSIVASFGGLIPGECHVEMNADTEGGGRCSGERDFEVIANKTVSVTVTLTCSGENESPSGSVRITSQFVRNACSNDRIKKIYAIPANVFIGSSTTVQVETYPGAVMGTPTWSFATKNDATNTGHASLSPAASCEGEACIEVNCTDVGSIPGTDPLTGLPSADVAIVVTLEDDECFDTEDVWVSCVDDTVCGDGVRRGSEQCDDGNLTNGDGCNEDCRLEPCPPGE